ncbi:class I SAM-dependent methyltransferase [Elusimicrobiota bacterium]
MEKITDDIYKKWHETYIKCTEEKEKIDAALTKVISRQNNRETFLDVGAGDGDLTARVAKHFTATTVIEPNKQVREVFEGQGMEFIEGFFENVDLGKRTFDFILCSHVFWLVKRPKQVSFIKKMHSLLSAGGKLAIIMVAPVGQPHDFYKKFFFRYDTTTHTILEDLHVMGLSSEVIPVSFNFGTDSFEDFFDILKLFTMQSWLHPVNLSDETVKKEIGDIEQYTVRML